MGGPRGYDAAKGIKGRKRHILVDTLGLLLATVVHSAGIQDPAGAKLVLAKIVGRFPRLRLIWTDGAYQPVVVTRHKVSREIATQSFARSFHVVQSDQVG